MPKPEVASDWRKRSGEISGEDVWTEGYPQLMAEIETRLEDSTIPPAVRAKLNESLRKLHAWQQLAADDLSPLKEHPDVLESYLGEVVFKNAAPGYGNVSTALLRGLVADQIPPWYLLPGLQNQNKMVIELLQQMHASGREAFLAGLNSANAGTRYSAFHSLKPWLDEHPEEWERLLPYLFLAGLTQMPMPGPTWINLPNSKEPLRWLSCRGADRSCSRTSCRVSSIRTMI